jgi:hypothetical protein
MPIELWVQEGWWLSVKYFRQSTIGCHRQEQIKRRRIQRRSCLAKLVQCNPASGARAAAG